MSRIHFDKRRDFLKGAACMAASGAASTFVPQLSMMGTALAQGAPSGYKALVCIYLSGGNDSWNLLIPGDNTTNIPVSGRTPLSGFSPTPYGWYATSRGGLFQGTADRLGITRPGGTDPGNTFLPPALGILGNQYGLNPAVPELQTLFNQGKLTFIANVGPLVEPLRRQGFNSFRRPPQLYSHNDQTSLWMIGGGNNASNPSGWGGRMAGQLLNTPPANGLAPCISISGQTRFLVGEYPSGQNLFPYRMSTSATSPSVTLNNYSGATNAGDKRREVLQGLLNETYPQAFTGAYKDVLNRSLSLATTVNQAITGLSTGGASSPYAAFNTAVAAIPNTGLGQQLRQVARMIAVSRLSGGAIAANRQVFYVSTGGYDTHGGQIPNARPNNGVWNGHQGLLQQVAQAMLQFNLALEALNNVSGYSGVKNEVVTFTMSEFSRTINSNGNGTDHAWGAVQMVMAAPSSQGGPLIGNQIYGRYPLQLLNRSYTGAPDLLGECFNRGEFLPTTAVDQMSATLARWMGVSSADLPLLFPNLGSFTNGAHPNAAVMAYNTQTLPFLAV
ncbi:DUF1501 domain-containing protein [uncultured Aquimonas sp.]|uniref:DUF1501 domain-containing protein n=1 Tax=uncultured Aquimonas sp. TaxID=385483 RepID=UPI00086E89DB|nr:DUF1501 domain-containing protein [uncultured Aquimonas sp.]ODU43483.1 MAG: hypothetical protein ABS96_22885 [Xanthomonadaceae bacterium SCN 69-123]